jgi:hypothetical protein
VCLAEITVSMDQLNFKFVLGSAYVHPDTAPQDIGSLLYQALTPYIRNRQVLPPFLNVDSDIPILPCGHFSVDTNTNPDFFDFIKSTFNLDCASNIRSLTALGGTCIDVTFTRHIIAETLRCISYFSYHRPIINRVCPSVSFVSEDQM